MGAAKHLQEHRMTNRAADIIQAHINLDQFMDYGLRDGHAAEIHGFPKGALLENIQVLLQTSRFCFVLIMVSQMSTLTILIASVESHLQRIMMQAVHIIAGIL